MKPLKPFNLEEALAGQRVMLRNGNWAIVAAKAPDTLQCHKTGELVGWNSKGEVMTWTVRGTFHSEGVSGYDIIGMAPVKQKRWLYINPVGLASAHYESEEALMQTFGKPEGTWQIVEIEV